MKLPDRARRFRRLILLWVFFCGLFIPGSGWAATTGMAQSGGYRIFLPAAMSKKPIPANVPLPSPSYYFYMRNYSQAKARSLGCSLGQRDLSLTGKQQSIVILDFGITKYINGQYGASGMQIGGFVTMNQIADAVEQFGLGYWTCTGEDYQSHVILGIGTNNYNHSDVYSNLSVTYNHGRAWAQMVNQVADWFVNVCPSRCNGQVSIVGANDIELAWSSPGAAIDWLRGYDSANLYPLYNFGAAEGCPNACGGGGFTWTRDQVLQVTNTRPVYPLPEIYLNNGANARQWFYLSQYSVRTTGIPFDFVGVMTNYTACQQYPEASCEYIDNTPEEGWLQLNGYVNGTDFTTYDDFPYVTDIGWVQ